MEDILITINKYSGIPAIIFFLVYLRNQKINVRIVFTILCFSWITDITTFYFIKYIYPNSYIITNPWYIINYYLVSWLFLSLLPERRKLIIGLIGAFTLGGIISFLSFYSFLESNTFIKSFSSLAFTLLSIIAFFEILRAEPMDKLSNYPIFWIVTGIFLFSSVTLLKNLFQNYLVFDLKISSELWSYVHAFNNVFNIIKNFMFLYAFMLIRKGYPDYIYPPKQLAA